MTLHLAADAPAYTEAPQDGEWIDSQFVTLRNPSGLHARPAAVLAREARRHDAHIVLSCGMADADAKSAIDVLALATRYGDVVRVRARGADAARAIATLERLLRDGCGERVGDGAVLAVDESVPPPASAAVAAEPTVARALPPADGRLTGVPASTGLVVGQIVQWRAPDLAFSETGGSFNEENARLLTALRLAAEQIEALGATGCDADTAESEIMHAHLALLDDPALLGGAITALRGGASAPAAWHRAYESVAGWLAANPHPTVRERALDVRDVGMRVMSLLNSVRRVASSMPERSIVVAADLTPSDTVSLDRTRVVGLCTISGGPTSHVAILARSMGIPAICGIDVSVLSLSNGTRAVLDGTAGTLQIEPDAAMLADVEQRMADAAATARVHAQAAHRAGATRDGHRVEVVANVRDAADAQAAVAAGAEGVGLLRSEFLFEDRMEAPDEDEQCAAYGAVMDALGPQRKCIVRTLDVGGDKPLRYLPLPKESNPFLGLRGIRVSLAYPDLFRSQLRAMLRAAPGGNLHVMFPMVSDLDEVVAAKRILREEQQRYAHPVKIGVMVEVPSAVAIMEALAREVDFFSIGTNDLAQYTLAIDRGNAKLASRIDMLHPAVLNMIDLTVSGAHAHGKWVGVCGAMASDLAATPVLVGLGVNELSVSIPAIAAVKARLAALDFGECRELATRVLKLGTAAQVRAAIAR